MLRPIPLHHVESMTLLGPDDPGYGFDPIEVDKAKRNAQWRACINLLASVLGTGLLVMPSACKLSGMSVFILGSLLSALACNLTACYLVETAKFMGPRGMGDDSTYAGLTSHIYGKRGEKIIEMGLVLQQFGACVGYIIVIGDIFFPLIQFYIPGSELLSENVIRNFFLWGFMFPLTIGVRNLGSLSFASTLAVGAIGLFCCTVIGNAMYIAFVPSGQAMRYQLEPENAIVGPFFFPESFLSLLRTLPLVCFAYDMHFNAIPVHEDMKLDVLPPHSSVQAFRTASNRAFSIAFVVTTCMGLAGYETFLNFTHADILRNFQVNGTYIAPMMNFVRALFGLGLALAFPMIIWELRQVLIILGGVHVSKFYQLTVAIFMCIAMLVVLVDNATTVFSFVGSTVTPTLDYIFPALLYIKSGAADKSGAYYVPRLLLLVGVVLVVMSLSTWITDRIIA